MKILHPLFASRFWSLLLKEIRQILSNKVILTLFIVPATIDVLLYGLALNPDVTQIRLGVVDYAQVWQSRELVSALTENQVFVAKQYLLSQQALGEQVRQGNVTLGLVIPPEFQRDLTQAKPAELQVLVDGVDANTAGIASGYIRRITQEYGRQLLPNPLPSLVQPQHVFLYNPGLKSSWFFVTGTMAISLTISSTVISSLIVIREKDTGTLEQLLMTPAAEWEIILAKTVPLFVLLMGEVFLALGTGLVVFGLPFRGALPIFLGLSGLYLLTGIGIGVMMATFARTQQQLILTAFFVNIPLLQLSGAIAPVDSMPTFFRFIALFNPLQHYVRILRGVILKGIGLNFLWSDALALGVFATAFLAISIRQFRKQLN